MSEFISETTEDYNSPTTSSFTTKLQSCRTSINVLEEVSTIPRAPWAMDAVCAVSATFHCKRHLARVLAMFMIVSHFF